MEQLSERMQIALAQLEEMNADQINGCTFYINLIDQKGKKLYPRDKNNKPVETITIQNELKENPSKLEITFH